MRLPKLCIQAISTPSDPLLLALLGVLSRLGFGRDADIKSLPKLYVACSGGRDSLALSHACLQLYQQGQLPVPPILLHVNHHLQAQAGVWADRVVDFARRHHLHCQVLSVHLQAGDENAARKARYQAFFDTMIDGGVLLLAHHREDQAETLLMRLISGAGLTGLAAMREHQIRRHANKHLQLLRPWLTCGRDDITDYARVHALPYVDDPSNDTGDNIRAILRRDVLPQLYAINPKATANIARSAALLDDARMLIDAQVKHFLEELSLLRSAAVCMLDIQALLLHTPAMQRSLLHAFIQGGAPVGCAYDDVVRVQAMCMRSNNNHHTQIYWQAGDGRGVQLCCYAGVLYRYDDALWRWLKQSDADEIKWQLQAGVWQLQAGVWQLVLEMPVEDIVTIVPLTRQTRIAFGRQHKSGKKLYQTLKIAPWLRQWLWLIQLVDGRTCLVGLHQAWYWQQTTAASGPKSMTSVVKFP